MIISITNKSKNFYAHTGKIFGSREVQRLTNDRFYDDDEKIWHVYYNKGVPDTFVSVKDNVIKNIWTENEKHLVEVLKDIKLDIKESFVTKYFKECYEKADYTIIENGSKNFIKIVGDYVDKEN